jgi:hypothetical protein
VCPHTHATTYALQELKKALGALYACPHAQATKYATTYALQELKKALGEALAREELATEELEAALTEKAALQVVK